ncbi:MAG: hypothetical protein Q8784_01630 [Vigna little leaf phytoplasma]|nr:hypothetical protein [Vigna little leaf phytoplasma]
MFLLLGLKLIVGLWIFFKTDVDKIITFVNSNFRFKIDRDASSENVRGFVFFGPFILIPLVGFIFYTSFNRYLSFLPLATFILAIVMGIWLGGFFGILKFC